MTDATPRTYPEGVPNWIEGRFPDPDADATAARAADLVDPQGAPFRVMQYAAA